MKTWMQSSGSGSEPPPEDPPRPGGGHRPSGPGDEDEGEQGEDEVDTEEATRAFPAHDADELATGSGWKLPDEYEGYDQDK